MILNRRVDLVDSEWSVSLLARTVISIEVSWPPGNAFYRLLISNEDMAPYGLLLEMQLIDRLPLTVTLTPWSKNITLKLRGSIKVEQLKEPMYSKRPSLIGRCWIVFEMEVNQNESGIKLL